MVKRSVVNLNFLSGYEYAFIDHMKVSTQFGGFVSTNPATWMQSIDADGWPTYSSITLTAGLGGIFIPDSRNFAGPYTIDGFGSGRVQMTPGQGTWTLGAATGVAQVSNGVYTVTDQGAGVRWTAQLTYSGPRQAVSLSLLRNDPSATGAYVRRWRIYRTADAADLAAGKVFRTPWKQTLVDLNPSAVRFMNWNRVNAGKDYRFENRMLPGYASYNGGNWVAGPKYGETGGTNQMTLVSVTGTPASMQHGEIAQCRIGGTGSGTGIARGGSMTVSAVTKANAGVANVVAHGFNSGDIIVHRVSAGMVELEQVPCTITVVDADHYSLGIDTTSYSTFTAGQAEQYVTLNVGNRGDFPVVFPDGHVTAGHYGNAYIATGDMKTFYFDKLQSAKRDPVTGARTFGVWIFNDLGAFNGHSTGVPLEICTALVNELNAMSPKNTINMWICNPHCGLTSGDPDYDSAQNFAVNAANVVLNGANGFAGLAAPAQLIKERANERWNAAFYQTLYLARAGFLRYGGSASDFSSYSSLRSVLMVNDVKASTSNNPRIKYVLAGQGTVGFTAGNSAIVDGTSNYNSDPLNIWSPATPMSHHDYFAWAAYFDASAAFYTANLTTLTASWVSHFGDAVAQEADCATFVAGIVGTGSGETTSRYGDALLPSYESNLRARGKVTVCYEGGLDTNIISVPSSGTLFATITSGSDQLTGIGAGQIGSIVVGTYIVVDGVPDNTTVLSKGATSLTMSKQATQNAVIAVDFYADTYLFLRAVKKSRAWANAFMTYFNKFNALAAADMPADYVEMQSRWGHAYPDMYDAAHVEGGRLDLTWQLMGLRNRGKRQVVW